MYLSKEGFVNCTAAARLNGYLDGYSSPADLQEELPAFGLSPLAGKQLINIVSKRNGRTGCKL